MFCASVGWCWEFLCERDSPISEKNILKVSAIYTGSLIFSFLKYASGSDLPASTLKGYHRKKKNFQVWKDPNARDSSSSQDSESHPGCSKEVTDNPEIERAFHLAGGSGRIVAILAQDSEDAGMLKFMNNSTFSSYLNLEQVLFFHVTSYDNFFYTLSEKYFEIFSAPMIKPNLFFMNGTKKVYDILGVNVCTSDAIIRFNKILHVYSTGQGLYVPILEGLPPCDPKENDSISKSCTVCIKKKKNKHSIQDALSLAGGTGRFAAILVQDISKQRIYVPDMLELDPFVPDKRDSNSEFKGYYLKIKTCNISEALQWAGGSGHIVAVLATGTPGENSLEFMDDPVFETCLYHEKIIFLKITSSDKYYHILCEIYNNIFHEAMQSPNLFFLNAGGKVYDILGRKVTKREAIVRIVKLIERSSKGNGLYVPSYQDIPRIPKFKNEDVVTFPVNCEKGEFSDIEYTGKIDEAFLLSGATGRIMAILIQDDFGVERLNFIKDPVVRSYLKLDQVLFCHGHYKDAEYLAFPLKYDESLHIPSSMPKLYLTRCDGKLYDLLGIDCTPKEARIRIKRVLQKYAQGEDYHVPRLDGLPNFDPDGLGSEKSHSAQKRGIQEGTLEVQADLTPQCTALFWLSWVVWVVFSTHAAFADSSQNGDDQVDEKYRSRGATRNVCKRRKK